MPWLPVIDAHIIQNDIFKKREGKKAKRSRKGKEREYTVNEK